MTSFLGSPDYHHGSQSHTGVLLVNLGTPEAPTRAAVRHYLKEFLSDPRVIEFPRWLWWLVLHGIILNVRPARTAKAYGDVWTADGSPLLRISERQAQGLQQLLDAEAVAPIKVALGMRYGKPSVRQALRGLHAQQIERLLVIPLYPQYSASTTASVFDAVMDELKTWRWVPALRWLNAYHDDPAYIRAIADKIRAHWCAHTRAEHLLFSFHGLPRRYLLAGDPYHCQCHKSARLVAQELALAEADWTIAFQSRFGREEWLRPYTDETLKEIARRGVSSVDVVCPGFAADCLETLEEIDKQNRRLYLEAGGKVFNYIPCLNDDQGHLNMLVELVRRHLHGYGSQDDPGALKRALARGASQ